MELATEPRLVALRLALEAERASGADFSDAWQRASTGLMADVLGGADRWVWSGVLVATREAWRRAYEGGRSSTVEAAVTELAAYAADGELRALRYEPAA